MSFNVKFAASLNQQHEAPHCASHSLESQHGVPPDESPGVCFKTHPRSQEKDEFGIRVVSVSQPASDVLPVIAVFDSSSCHPAGFLGIDVPFLLIHFLKAQLFFCQ